MGKIKPNFLIGLILILLGVGAITIDQISYTREETLIEFGPFEASVIRKPQYSRLPVVFGALVIVAGIALITLEINKRS